MSLNTHLRTQIWNRYRGKNKSSNDVIRRRSAPDVCWDEPLVSSELYVEFEYLGITENFYQGIIPSVFLRYKITKTNALSLPEWN